MHLDNSDKLILLKFREKLVTDIVVKYATPTTSSRHRRGGSKNNKLHLIGQHFPAYVDNMDNSNLKKNEKILDDVLYVTNMECVKKHVLYANNVINDFVQCLALKTTTL